MWIVGQPGDANEYGFSTGLDAPATIVLSDVPESVQKLAAQTSANVVVRNGLSSGDYAALVDELTDGRGFDDIVVLDPRSAASISTKIVASRITMSAAGHLCWSRPKGAWSRTPWARTPLRPWKPESFRV